MHEQDMDNIQSVTQHNTWFTVDDDARSQRARRIVLCRCLPPVCATVRKVFYLN